MQIKDNAIVDKKSWVHRKYQFWTFVIVGIWTTLKNKFDCWLMLANKCKQVQTKGKNFDCAQTKIQNCKCHCTNGGVGKGVGLQV